MVTHVCLCCIFPFHNWLYLTIYSVKVHLYFQQGSSNYVLGNEGKRTVSRLRGMIYWHARHATLNWPISASCRGPVDTNNGYKKACYSVYLSSKLFRQQSYSSLGQKKANFARFFFCHTVTRASKDLFKHLRLPSIHKSMAESDNLIDFTEMPNRVKQLFCDKSRWTIYHNRK